MSTGKRLAKRSIIGTRVCALGTDGFYYAGVIQNVKSPHNSTSPSFIRAPLGPPSDPALVSTPNSANMYVVRFDVKRNAVGPGKVAIHHGVPQNREFRDVELIGPGFRNILDCTLKRGQKIFVTNNGRECNGEVVEHDIVRDEVTIKIVALGHEVSAVAGCFLGHKVNGCSLYFFLRLLRGGCPWVSSVDCNQRWSIGSGVAFLSSYSPLAANFHCSVICEEDGNYLLVDSASAVMPGREVVGDRYEGVADNKAHWTENVNIRSETVRERLRPWPNYKIL